MSNLMIAPEDKTVSRSDLDSFTAGILKAHTHSHKPRPFADVVNMAQDELERIGFHVGEEQYVLARNNTQMFAMLEIVNFKDGEESRLSYAIRTSMNKTLSESHALAETIVACTNLEIWAKQSMATKNTRFIDTRVRSMVREYVGRVTGLVEQHAERKTTYKTTVINETFAALAIKRMYEANVINTQRIGAVIDQYNYPTHAEHLGPNGERTSWTLFNAVTEAFKGSPISTYAERCDGLHDVIGNATQAARARGFIIEG